MAFLSKYRVLDLTDARGLMAGRMLADLGADVVQVEPAGGCDARSQELMPTVGGDSYLWRSFAANKRSVELDLNSEAGRSALRGLVAAADILIESHGPSVMAKFGLDWEQLKVANPSLVYVSITAFGRTGPKAAYVASDLIVWSAGGPLDPHRDEDRAPVRPSIPQAFRQAAADAAAGAILALIARNRTGRGQLVDVSAQACLGVSTLATVLAYSAGDLPQKPGEAKQKKRFDQSGSGSATTSAMKKWAGKDGTIEFHLGLGPANGRFTNNFFRWMLAEGEPVEKFAALDWCHVPTLIDQGELDETVVRDARIQVGVFLATKSKREMLAASVRHKLLAVPIYTTADIAACPQLRAREFFVAMGERERACVLPGPPARVSIDAFDLRRAAPRVGEHTREVLSEWQPVQDSRARAPATACKKPLEGLKVLDLTWVVAGPVVSRALADFGATVIRVESSTRVETARFMPPFIGGEASIEDSALYHTTNAGKLGITVNLQDERGRQVIRDLSRWADVVMESFSPGTMEKWGLGYEDLRKERANLIMMSSSLYGATGPISKLAGYGNVGAALSGFQEIYGQPDRVPLGPFGPYTDFVAPRMALPILLGALDHRERTGEGCYIDVSQVESGVFFQSPEIAAHFSEGFVATRMGNDDRAAAPHGVYRTRDDALSWTLPRYVAIAAATDAQWQRLATWMQRDDLSRDAELATASGRLRRRRELDHAVAEAVADRLAEEVESALQALGVPAHVSANSQDFCTDAQLAHRKHLIALPHPRHGTVTVEGPRYLLSDTPGFPETTAPTLGRDNEQVLENFAGYSSERIRQLVSDGVMK